MNAQAVPVSMADGHDDNNGLSPQSVWSRHAGAIVLTMLITSLAGFGIYRLQDPQTLPIRHVRVKGQFQHLSTGALQERADKVVRGGFFNVNVETIQSVLLEEPWIREVSVKRVWPDRITVTIREQTAVARWNGSALLNEDARVFTPEKETFPADIPSFKGPEGAHTQMLEFYRRLRTALPEEFRIAEVTLSERRAWHVGFLDGPHVYLGRTDIANRLNRFVEYVPGNLENMFNNIRSVDMRYTNGFAVRWEPDYKPDL